MQSAIYNMPPGEGDEKSRFPKRVIDPWLVAHFSVAAGRFRATYSSVESFDDLRIEELSHKICVLQLDEFTITALALIAQSRAWEKVWIEGDTDFKDAVWIAMGRLDIEVVHTPSKNSRNQLSRLMDLDEENRGAMRRFKRNFKYKLKTDAGLSDLQRARALKKYLRRAAEESTEAFQEQRVVAEGALEVYKRDPLVSASKKNTF